MADILEVRVIKITDMDLAKVINQYGNPDQALLEQYKAEDKYLRRQKWRIAFSDDGGKE